MITKGSKTLLYGVAASILASTLQGSAYRSAERGRLHGKRQSA